MSFAESLEFAKSLDVRLIPYEKAEGMGTMKSAADQIKPGESIGVFIGPEGGFEEAEIEQAMEQAIIPVTLVDNFINSDVSLRK